MEERIAKLEQKVAELEAKLATLPGELPTNRDFISAAKKSKDLALAVSEGQYKARRR